jgi:hypothetical protein
MMAIGLNTHESSHNYQLMNSVNIQIPKKDVDPSCMFQNYLLGDTAFAPPIEPPEEPTTGPLEFFAADAVALVILFVVEFLTGIALPEAVLLFCALARSPIAIDAYTKATNSVATTIAIEICLRIRFILRQISI